MAAPGLGASLYPGGLSKVGESHWCPGRHITPLSIFILEIYPTLFSPSPAQWEFLHLLLGGHLGFGFKTVISRECFQNKKFLKFQRG